MKTKICSKCKEEKDNLRKGDKLNWKLDKID